jgi:Tol biopolymer transport system component
MTLAVGQRVGPYEVSSALGAGGMGEVYRARDTRLKREVALKTLPREWAIDTDRLARFQREAELLAALNHPNIAAIYGVEEIEGVRALVLELVEGPTLADRLAAGPLPLDDALAVARQIIDALDAAHEKGIAHRDLKPSNVKVRGDGTVKVLDFGLAKVLEPDNSPVDPTASPTVTSPAMTRGGVILGTAAYMSPEQARGQLIDKRTDIWAFGCVLYEMLSGRRAFERDSVPDTIAAVLEREPDWSVLPGTTPPRIVRLLRRCLEKSRGQRLRDIADARDSLDERGDERRPAAATASAPPRPVLLVGVAAVSVAIGAAAVGWLGGDAPPGADGKSPGAQFRRLTTDGAYSTEPALSRDGTMVVYASDHGADGQLDLWLQRIAGGQPLRLTDAPADERQPDFSPDGRLIAFRSNRDGGGVYVMPSLGGNARLVAEHGRRPRFSPDGRNIAYWAGPWLSAQGPRAPGSAVFVVPATGGTPRRVAEGFVTARDPIWSPDGQSLLFFGRKSADETASGRFDWWWAPLDGRQPVHTGAFTTLQSAGLDGAGADGLAELKALPSVWTDAGVVFSAQFGGSINLWRLGISERTGQVIEGSLDRLTNGPGSDLLASVDGVGRVAFQLSSEGYVELTLALDSNAGRPTGPVRRQSFVHGVSGGPSSLDHSGRWLAYTKNRDSESEIWVRDLATGQERHLVTAPPVLFSPTISPDGASIAYTLHEGELPAGYVVPAAGGQSRQVCSPCALFGWFSDSRRILANWQGHVRALDVIDGRAVDLVVSQTGGVTRPVVSPDGRWLSLLARRQVWILPVRPGNPPPEREWVSVHKVEDNSAERACGWSPDSRFLYLLLERDGFRDLYARRIDRASGAPVGEPFVVQHLHDPRRRWGWTSAGNAIVRNAFVFSQLEMTGSIWVLDPRKNTRGGGERE